MHARVISLLAFGLSITFRFYQRVTFESDLINGMRTAATTGAGVLLSYCLSSLSLTTLKTAELREPCEARRKNPHLNRAKFRLRVFCLGLWGLTPGRICSWGEMPQENPISKALSFHFHALQTAL